MQWLVSLPDRLDSFLALHGRMLSRAKAQEAITNGQVSVNDVVITKSSQRLQEGDTVRLEQDNEQPSAHSWLAPTDLHFEILYEDSACMVINKPAGIMVHPGNGMSAGEKTILDGVAFLFEKRGLPFLSDATLVHRLDKETTGCLLIAKNRESHLFLQKQFESRTVRKHYLALVAGIPARAHAVVDAPIGRSVSDRTKMAIMGATGNREAKTSYRIIARQEKVALLECEIHTGRTHQVRVHLSSIGHPILGDSTYVSTLSERLTQENDIGNLCLHAWKLRFVSPDDQKEHEVMAPIPSTLQSVLEKIGIQTNFLTS